MLRQGLLFGTGMMEVVIANAEEDREEKQVKEEPKEKLARRPRRSR